jgi:hypothetical protein
MGRVSCSVLAKWLQQFLNQGRRLPLICSVYQLCNGSNLACVAASPTAHVSKELLRQLSDQYQQQQQAARIRWMKDTIFKSAQLMHVQVRAPELTSWTAIADCAVLAPVRCVNACSRGVAGCITRTQTTWSHVLTDCSVVFTGSNISTSSSFL